MYFVFEISAASTTPIFRQVVDQVRLAVATGQLIADEKLPSVRDLAQRLLVNPNTIAKAYSQLSRDGVIETQPGRGVFIAPPRQRYTDAERDHRLAPLIDAVVIEAISLGFQPEELIAAIQRQLEKIKTS